MAHTQHFLHGRRVAIGIGGSIAAYKACELTRELRRHGAQVRVAMTDAAQTFMTPLTMQSLSGHPVLTACLDAQQDVTFGHLALARWADVFIVAPATADLLAKLRCGMASDAVTTTVLAFRGPVLLAPAMNTAMWENTATQENVRALLTQPRFRMLGPDAGELADGDIGMGRLAKLPSFLSTLGGLQGKKVLITAGPTRESIDFVRFISSPSSGKMGLAVAQEARVRGADVTVVLGPVACTPQPGLSVVQVRTADEMLAEVMARVEDVDVFVSAAAVSDFKPATFVPHKVKKDEAATQLMLVPTPDVLATASQHVHGKHRRPLLIGFAAETHAVLASASEKLAQKRLDFILANDLTGEGAGFEYDSNRVTMLGADGSAVELSGTKHEIAARLWELVAAHDALR